jgi:hypothetical protein
VALDESFAEAWLNNDHKVLGFRLLPFSLWHKFLLTVTGSRALTGDQLSMFDVVGFCKVCTNRYPSAKYKFTKLDQLRILLTRNKKNVSERVESYIKDYCAFPEFWEKKQGEGKATGGPPDPLGSVVSLLAMGFSVNEAWDMPLGMAQYYTSAYMQQQGADIEFITSEEKELFESMKNGEDDDEPIDWAEALKAEPQEGEGVDWDEVLKKPEPKQTKKRTKEEEDFLREKFGGKTELTPEEHEAFINKLRTEPAAKL